MSEFLCKFAGNMRFQLIHLDETSSTNSYCKQLAQERAAQDSAQNYIVTTDFQTAGRGCGTNTWESERGKNLLFSVLLHPARVPAANQFILSMANSLALTAVMDDYLTDIKIKWPNDIYWRDSKICGTLIETTLQGSEIRDCIIGTGINVNQHAFLSDAPNPVSLCQVLGREADLKEVMEKVMVKTSEYMEMVNEGAWDEIRQSYRQHLYRLNEIHRYRFQNGHEEECRLVNVTDEGCLELLHDNGKHSRWAFKEVQFMIS